jgi:hypothetical protein
MGLPKHPKDAWAQRYLKPVSKGKIAILLYLAQCFRLGEQPKPSGNNDKIIAYVLTSELGLYSCLTLLVINLFVFSIFDHSPED